MIKHREILRMANLGLSQRNIAESLNCSRTTVAEVLRRAREEHLTWPLPPELSDPELEQILFPHKGRASTRKEPDYEQVHTELAKKGVTLSLFVERILRAMPLSCRNPLSVCPVLQRLQLQQVCQINQGDHAYPSQARGADGSGLGRSNG